MIIIQKAFQVALVVKVEKEMATRMAWRIPWMIKAKFPRGPETSLCVPERRYNFLCVNCNVTKRKREKEREEREKKPHVIVTILKQGFFLFFFRCLYYCT